VNARAARPEEDPGSASAGERLHAARYVLAGAAVALVATSVLWNVPLLYPFAAIAALVLIAAFAPRRRAPRSIAGANARPAVSPDASVKAMMEALRQAAFILDTAGVVRYANARAGELFPATRLGDAFTITFRWPEIGAALREASAGRRASVDFHEPGEATKRYAVSFTPLRPAGGAAFVLVAFDDVSDKLAIARMRADFVANASHELRTPLASLTGFIETLLGPARNDPDTTEKFLKIMLDQARRMRRLIDDLLSLSRVEMRAHSRPTDRVDLVAVLHHVADALGPLARELSVALLVDAPAEALEVTGSRDELVQVFQNLIENGIRYGASGGCVEVSVEPRPKGRPVVAVHVQDYGPGIAEEHLPRLTERFYRVDAGASREMKGTGLGLAIVRHILVRHQGRLDVKSRPGEGARFTVELPFPQEARPET
jgi:two-component system phosphate regulon sensor histidine kinase PhoR